MTKKDVFILLSPSIFFIVVAVAAFLTSEMIRRHTHYDGSRQKFDTFVTNVQSGKWQLTTNKWLEGMQREEATAEAYRDVGADSADMMRVFAWTSLAGIVFQTAVVFSVKKRLRKP
jgi:hypothetical protein